MRTKPSYVGRCLLASALSCFTAAAFGCAGEVLDSEPGTSVEATQAALQEGDTPEAAGGTQKEITIASLPDAKCTLIATETGNSTLVQADDEGLVHLWAAPSAKSARFTLDCDEPSGTPGKNKMAQYAFDLAKPETFAPGRARAQSKRRRVLQPLLDPKGMSQNAVTAAGYPPRPDADSPRYAKWLELVSRQITVIDADTVETDLHRDPVSNVNSQNWSGLALNFPGTAPYANYTDAYSFGGIPHFSQQGTGTSIASLWVGLGGYYDTAIIQEGIDGVSNFGVTVYKPWYEYYPNSLVYPSFSMSPGDSVTWEVFECDANRNYGPSYHGYACFQWTDVTKSTSYSKTVKKPTGATFTGNTCESIVERVSDCGSLCRLSSWSGVNWQSFECWDAGQMNTWNIQTDPYLNITMQNSSGQNMVVVSAGAPPSAGFDWLRSN